MQRFFNWLKALFNRGMNRLEDPEMMLDQARRDMQQAAAQNRERAVQAIAQRNRLQMMLDEAEKKSAMLENQAAQALRSGNRDLARDLVREKANNDAIVESLRGSLQQAITTVEAVKIAIRRQEEEVRKKTAEVLAMKAQWKQAQIQNSISKALEGLTFENQLDSFNAAADRIRDAQSEALARQEMMAESVQGRVRAMQDQAIDYAAEEELQKLEEKLGMRPATTSATTEEVQVQTVSVGEGSNLEATPEIEAAAAQMSASEIDQQLAELEKRISGLDKK